jgi:hypothetical protein
MLVKFKDLENFRRERHDSTDTGRYGGKQADVPLTVAHWQ